MTCKKRIEARYIRRKNKRYLKDLERNNKYGNVNNAFCFHKVMYYAYKCCKGVGYKKSTQYFKLHIFTNVSVICNNIKNNNYKVGDTYKFTINERGKIRNIDAPHILDRLVHKTISNEILKPIYLPHLIYDNGASIKNKGFKFSIDRVKKKLYSWYLKYGINGYVILIDYSKFFPNCSHDVIRNIHKKYIWDEYTRKIIEDFLFINDGISLGVEMAQIEASIIPNELDHLVNSYKFPVIRYMDDTFMLVKNEEDGKKLLNIYEKMANVLNIKINKKKTNIIKIYDGFIFCKWKFKINPNGKIIRIPHKNTVRRQKKKLRKMIRLYLNNRINYDEVNIVKNSFKAYLNVGNTYIYKKNIDKIK